ncbi:MAG TPA: hypothetical protein VME46_22580 [Acidimicrobiales bacterium]|nr:hypothetical protein [Acidimicrobiales bacterium]
MATQDDLRRCAESAGALVNGAASRARKLAETLFGPREQAEQRAREKTETLVDETRRAAAEVIGTIRQGATVLVRDLEHLEDDLRASRREHESRRPGRAGPAESTPGRRPNRGPARTTTPPTTAPPTTTPPATAPPTTTPPATKGATTTRPTATAARAARASKASKKAAEPGVTDAPGTAQPSGTTRPKTPRAGNSSGSTKAATGETRATRRRPPGGRA